jgi:hypothetical protein
MFKNPKNNDENATTKQAKQATPEKPEGQVFQGTYTLQSAVLGV